MVSKKGIRFPGGASRPPKQRIRDVLGRALLALYPLSAAATDLSVHVMAEGDAPLPGTVVGASPVGSAAVVKPSRDVIDQIDKQFVPPVKVIPVGTAVQFPNKDQIRHHVYSFSPAKTFEIPLYIGTPTDRVVFDKPGVVVLGCNIHDWMRAYVFVTDARHVAAAGSDGTVRFKGLPPGEYQVTVWHPRLQGVSPQTQRLTLAGPSATLDVRIELKAEILPRRSSVLAVGPGY